MAYEKTLWKDRVVEKPNTYRSVENPDGTITLYPITGQVIEKGTPVSAANLNKIENGIVELNEQLDNIETKKFDKDGILSMANMGQDVKEAMTNGSVAVVGKNTVLSENIVDKQITPVKTNFFDTVNFISLSNLKFIEGYVDFNGKLISSSDTISLVTKVDANTTYILTSDNIQFNRANIIGSTLNDFTFQQTYRYIGDVNIVNNTITFTVPKEISWICIYVYTGSTYNKTYFEQYKNTLYLFKDKVPNIKNDTINKNFLPSTTLYKDDNIAQYVKNGTITPIMTSFFESYNLINFPTTEIKVGTCTTHGVYEEGDTGKVIIFNVNPSTTYYIKKPTSSNRSFALENSTAFVGGKSYNIVSVSQVETETNVFKFTTGSTTNYILFYYYYGSDNTATLKDFNLTYDLANINKGEYLRKEYLQELTKNYIGKKVLTMGDSITAINENETNIWSRSWRKYFKEILQPSKLSNTAVPGATWRDKDGTVYDGNPQINGSDNNINNVMGNQLEILLRAKDSTHPNYVYNAEYDDFDIIIIACGTNDTESIIPTTAEIETQFHNNGTPITNLTTLNRKTWQGAMRYVVDNLRKLYPNAQIFLCTPIQKTGNKYEDILNKNAIIKNIARRLSSNIIDTMVCGVYDMSCPSIGEEGDYNDGLHLSPQGASKMGKYIAKEVINNLV